MNALALGVVFGLGALLLTAGLLGGGRGADRHVRHRAQLGPGLVLPLAVALGTGIVVFLITGWLVGAALAGLGAGIIPRAVADAARPGGAIERAEGVATWAEMLRDTMAAAAGLEEAILSTAAVAPLAIRPHVQHLAARLQRDRLAPALRGFADEVDDPAADLVVAALLLASEHRARDLGGLLGALSKSARMEAAMVLRVEAGRSRLRTAARVVTITTLGFALLLVLFNGDFLAPYDDALGQAWLLVVGSLFALGIRELGRLSKLASPPRLLAPSARVEAA
ncbi:MAG TPA: pilus assembly protein TadB [Acidimicrobiia bacterium]|nr:pilus assembly protein TadB [Acidimicrobiia bacterium]